MIELRRLEPLGSASVGCDGGKIGISGIVRSGGVSMDRLVRSFLTQFIRRGSITFTTASGAKFTCGDGTGEPLWVRFTTAQTERRILLNPELAVGEAYMDGTFVVESGGI